MSGEKLKPAKRLRVFHNDELRDAEVLERNGSMRYVEFENGERDWIYGHDVQAVLE